MYRTDDPIADFLAHDRERENRISNYPRCVECGERNVDEKAYHIDGKFYCEECMGYYHRYIDEFID